MLVARWHRYTGEVSYFRCWTPGNVSLGTLVQVIPRRWQIEETHQLAKDFTGLDQGQVTCWNSWMRWSLFSLIAAAVLALTAAIVHEATEERPELVPLTCPELIRLLRALALPHQSATGITSCTGPPGAAATKPLRQRATSNDTAVTTSRDQELQLPYLLLEIFCGYSQLGRVERTERIVDGQTGKLSFLTNHAGVLLVIARDPASRLRDIAAGCHVPTVSE